MALCNSPAPFDVPASHAVCLLPLGHSGGHAVTLLWFGSHTGTWTELEPLAYADDYRRANNEAPTLKLPPVRDSLGPRRPPPALRTLPPGSAELLHLIADALKADEDLDDGPTL